MPHASGNAGTQEGLRLVVPVHGDALRREVRSQGDKKLILTSHVEGETFLLHPASNARGQKRLRRIMDVLRLSVGLRHVAAAGAEVLFVHHHHGRAVFRSDV